MFTIRPHFYSSKEPNRQSVTTLQAKLLIVRKCCCFYWFQSRTTTKRCDGTTVFNYTFNCIDGQVNLCKCPPPHPLITFYVLIPGHAIHRLIRESESSLASMSFLSRKNNVNFLYRHAMKQSDL